MSTSCSAHSNRRDNMVINVVVEKEILWKLWNNQIHFWAVALTPGDAIVECLDKVKVGQWLTLRLRDDWNPSIANFIHTSTLMCDHLLWHKSCAVMSSQNMWSWMCDTVSVATADEREYLDKLKCIVDGTRADNSNRLMKWASKATGLSLDGMFSLKWLCWNVEKKSWKFTPGCLFEPWSETQEISRDSLLSNSEEMDKYFNFVGSCNSYKKVECLPKSVLKDILFWQFFLKFEIMDAEMQSNVISYLSRRELPDCLDFPHRLQALWEQTTREHHMSCGLNQEIRNCFVELQDKFPLGLRLSIEAYAKSLNQNRKEEPSDENGPQYEANSEHLSNFLHVLDLPFQEAFHEVNPYVAAFLELMFAMAHVCTSKRQWASFIVLKMLVVSGGVNPDELTWSNWSWLVQVIVTRIGCLTRIRKDVTRKLWCFGYNGLTEQDLPRNCLDFCAVVGYPILDNLNIADNLFGFYGGSAPVRKLMMHMQQWQGVFGPQHCRFICASSSQSLAIAQAALHRIGPVGPTSALERRLLSSVNQLLSSVSHLQKQSSAAGVTLSGHKRKLSLLAETVFLQNVTTKTLYIFIHKISKASQRSELLTKEEKLNIRKRAKVVSKELLTSFKDDLEPETHALYESIFTRAVSASAEREETPQ